MSVSNRKMHAKVFDTESKNWNEYESKAKDIVLSPFSILKELLQEQKFFHLHSKSKIIFLLHVEKESYRILAKAVHGYRVRKTAPLIQLAIYKKSIIYECITRKKEVRQMINIPITLRSDEKGYFDRECPNENCLYTFKVYMQDWEQKIATNDVHCPMCGHIASHNSWWTQEQLAAMQENVASYAKNLILKELDKSLGKLARSTRNNKYVKISYKPGRRVSFVNNPIGQREEWETDITCEVCGTRYSVIGSAYFCPCCGHNSVIAVFDESMDTVEKMVDSLSEMKAMLEQRYGRDKAETMCRDMREDTLGNIVSAFQKFAEGIYKNKSSKAVWVNDFQIVEKGSKLFLDAVGKGYETWLSSNELVRMNLLFQKRHILEHNNGIVDDKYLQKSGDSSYVLGQRIVVHDTDAIELLTIIKKLATGLKTI